MAHFYLDENIPVAVAEELLLLGHTADTARSLNALQASDDQHLLAARSGSIFVTRNRGDFVLLHSAWQRWSRAWQVSAHHPGILVTPHAWLAPQTAFEVARFIGEGLPLQDRLYEWRRERWIAVTIVE